MGQAPGEVREQIEHTREQMGETVDALAHKANVPARVSDYAQEKTSKMTGRARDVGHSVERLAHERPLALVSGAAAAGLLTGLLLPETKVEKERLGPVATEIGDRGKELGREAVERGKHVAEEAASSAVETAKQEGRKEGEELSASLREQGQQPQ